ncbi:unnamed protein product [Pieris brassicae]|uniref:Uncharacterized protein n=1 Tax=Pieris brassicae TaxID=7116 RepID=A0A9P0TG94_PIEBR|nr:unnamed protein product [Pieris brassicae]
MASSWSLFLLPSSLNRHSHVIRQTSVIGLNLSETGLGNSFWCRVFSVLRIRLSPEKWLNPQLGENLTKTHQF